MRVSCEEAAQMLLQGKVVAVPTETVYGLAASLASPKAVEAIYALKKRPSSNPLIIHACDLDQIFSYISFRPDGFEQLAQAFWPGPMTLVVPIACDRIPEVIRAGLPKAAFRIPAHPLARKLIAETGPLVMPSANLSGRPSATTPEHVEQDFGIDFPVIDGGACTGGVESTVLLEENGWKIIRQGILIPEDFMSVLPYLPEIKTHSGKTPLCPGQMFRHYAPKAKLVLQKSFTNEHGVVLGYPNRAYPQGCQVRLLGANPYEAAQNLYTSLRKLDEDQIPMAYVDFQLPDEGLWRTLKERLSKAANC